VNFDVVLGNFPAELANLAPDMNTAIPAGRPVAQLFRSLGLEFRAGVAARHYADAGGDGTDDAVIRSVHDASGAVISLSVDRALDGTVDSVTSYTRGVMGRVSEQRFDDDADGDRRADYSRAISRSHDTRGNLLLVTDRESGDSVPGDPLDLRISANYDDFGRILSEINESRDAAGQVRTRDRFTYSRNARGNATLRTGEYDDDADGVVDTRTRVDATFDAADRVLTTDDVQDYGDDGQPDWRQFRDYDYDPAGRLREFTESTDFDGDGTFDHVSAQIFWYDAAGNLERATHEIRDSRGAAFSAGHEHVFSYDGDRRLLTHVQVIDVGLDGVPDERIEVDDDYDAQGLKLARSVTWLNLHTGLPMRASRVDLSYDANGAQNGESSAWDTNGDGIVDSRESTRVEFDAANDALGQIIGDYFAL
jgi:hypothetical protein